jgi:predicted acetyltransferase
MINPGIARQKPSLRLQRPGPEHEAAVLDYKAAFLAAGDSMDGTAGLRNAASYAEWLEKLDKNSREESVETGLVPATTYLVLRLSDGCLVGMIDIRHRLSDYLLQHGGHIGYSVHPDERRKGYATAMLALALEYCARPAAAGGLGLARVLLTCDADNMASARTIEANGGVLENQLPEDGRMTSRYWIDSPRPSR